MNSQKLSQNEKNILMIVNTDGYASAYYLRTVLGLKTNRCIRKLLHKGLLSHNAFFPHSSQAGIEAMKQYPNHKI